MTVTPGTSLDDQAGVVDVDRTAPVSGSYRGAEGMGPVWSMTQASPASAAARSDPEYFWGQQPATFTVTVTVNGARAAQTSFDRSLSVAPFTDQAETLKADGFIGDYYQPASGSGRRPVVLYFGGSEGGPASPLLGVHYPSLVHAVIASVPSNTAVCSYPGYDGPAWTFDGKPVPYVSKLDAPAPANAAAVILDQQINGPVFLDCGEADQIWPSCPHAQAIMTRLDAAHDRWAHVLYRYPGAGHLVGSLVPYEPAATSVQSEYAPSYAVIAEAEPVLWQHLLTFLATFAASGN